MNRFQFCLFIILTFCYLGDCRQPKPHILFIVADDLGWNDVGWHNPEVKTPNLDNLAKNGVVLNNSYVHPVCTPSRNAFMTGLYPFRVGLQNGVIGAQEKKHIPENVQTLPERLKSVGYATHMVGKWHLGFCKWKYTPTGRGFDSFMGFYTGAQDYYKHTRNGGYDFRFNNSVYYPRKNQYSTKTYAKRAIEIFKNSDPRKQPLFLYLSFQSVHTPLQVPKRYENMYKHVKNEQRRKYLGMVTAMDDAIGEVVKATKKYRFMKNLLLVFTSDNGGAAHIAGNNLPLRGTKGSLWEGGTRVPTIVYSKTLLKRRQYVNNGMMHAVDWYATFLKIGGWKPSKVDKRIDGVNQWPMLRKGKPSARREFVYHIDSKANRAAIRMGKFKLIVGKPGIYNSWYSVPTGQYFCPINDENEEGAKTELFLYPSLNNMADNVKGFMNWAVSKVPGYRVWRKYKRFQSVKKCKEYHKKELRRWVFPKYLMFDLKRDPTERHNIAGYYPKIFQKLKRRLDRYLKYVRKPQSTTTYESSNPKFYNGTWSPGWC